METYNCRILTDGNNSDSRSVVISAPIWVSKKETSFIAHCSVLGVASQGDTPESARANFLKTLNDFLLACRDKGTLDQVLEDAVLHPPRYIYRRGHEC